ncbi:MAG: biotin--[acetyl-CoA-carboxylase] ligase [Hyphomonadaceae bacterium]|nr:biotin--[acetyl-CoA-carboxylase] ligase [Hyphomonadaceae bacterium]
MIQHAPVYWYDEIDSTSEEAKRRARGGETSAVWIAARQQTAGRGRLGRNWVSPTGNLFTTVLFPEPGGLTVASRIPFAAALAVRDACTRVVPDLDAKLKWPNDVRIDRAKICGILTESGETNGVVWIALGMGINVQHAPAVFEQASTSLVEQGAPAAVAPEHVLDDLRTNLDQRVTQARNNFEQLLEDWLRHAEGLGQIIEAGPHDRRVQGVFEGLAPDGGLNLRLPDGSRQTIRAGDVDLVRQVD